METYLAAQEEVIRELVRVLDDKGSICWQVGNHVDENWPVFYSGNHQ